jgi:hypothetical protein
MKATATVNGDIKARRLSVEDGVTFVGRSGSQSEQPAGAGAAAGRSAAVRIPFPSQAPDRTRTRGTVERPWTEGAGRGGQENQSDGRLAVVRGLAQAKHDGTLPAPGSRKPRRICRRIRRRPPCRRTVRTSSRRSSPRSGRSLLQMRLRIPARGPTKTIYCSKCREKIDMGDT